MRRPAPSAVAALLAAAMVASACGTSFTVDEPTAAPAPTVAATSAPAVTPAPVEPEASPSPIAEPTPFAVGDSELLPVDPGVRIGTLDNGLTYYIRPNTAPGGRAEFRLAVNAGSAAEDDDQSAVAHFVEHMMFNGTERYPSNELIALLESFGSEFGPDINAYTSYDETVYELSVPTDNQDLVAQAVGVLREWAGNATIDPDEVAAEIGVVVEEWRERDQGIGGRVGDLYEELLATGTGYEGRSPIGEVDAIESMSADLLRRFYNDWYRPDLMAVVAVGDFDPDVIEDLIAATFSDLEGPDDPRPRPQVAVEVNAEFKYQRLGDPELPSAFVEIVYAGPRWPDRSLGDFRKSLAFELGATILDTRFADDVSRGATPYLRAQVSDSSLGREFRGPSLLAEAAAPDLAASFEALLVEVQRVANVGFSEAELDRAVSSFRAGLEQAYGGRDTTQDASYAAEYVAQFLSGEPSLSWDDLLRIEGAQLDDMTPLYVADMFLRVLRSGEPSIAVVGPANEAELLPTQDALAEIVDRLRDAIVDERGESEPDIDSLMDAPPPVDIVASGRNRQLDSQSITFANGVTVLLKPTQIAENGLVVRAVSPGGTSVFDESELAAVFVASDVVLSSGVGPADQVQLSRLLADSVVSLAFDQDDTAEFLSASSSTEDLETLLQLIFQYFTAPRVETAALDSFLAELRPFAEDPGQVPSVASSIELLEARYGSGRRYQILPSVSELEQLNVSDVRRAFDQMYGDAGDFTFTIVGDFDLEAVTLLAARYLGNLPGDAQADSWVDYQPPAPDGIVERTVRAGADQQGTTTVLITAEAGSDQVRDIRLQILENILSTRLRDRLREALGATYSPVAEILAEEQPDELIETFIQVNGEPGRLNEIVDEIEAVLLDLRGGGLTDGEVATASEQVRSSFELVSNDFWTEQMLYADAHPAVTMLTVERRIALADSTSVADIQALIDLALPVDQYIIVNLIPE